MSPKAAVTVCRLLNDSQVEEWLKVASRSEWPAKKYTRNECVRKDRLSSPNFR
jgi:hypothetical protein